MENQDISAEYDGKCAFAVSTGKLDVDGGKDKLVINGKTYLFSNVVAKFLFKVLPARVSKADAHWSRG